MKEGRMKGQAFVGLPSEQSAEKALRETNGYVFYDKPLVVVSFYPLFRKQKQGQGFYKVWRSRLYVYLLGFNYLVCRGGHM